MFRAASAARIASRRSAALQRKPPARRWYAGSAVPAAYFTPMEEIMMDATAWFVASAIAFAPEHEFDDLDYQNLEDLHSRAKKMEKDRENERKK
jgi:hypothetical protein